MGRYLDSLNEKFDEITKGAEEILDRAADEGREVTKEEQELVDRAADEAETLKKSIEHYTAQEATRSKVASLRGTVPTGPQRTSTTVVVEREKDPDKELLAAFPTMGDYIVAVSRAFRGDKEAEQLLERATAHQTTADNPGLIPRPIVGPVITAVANDRPFIASIANKRLTNGSFDRPVITQHVAVGKQTAEKALTESQKLLIGKLPVAAATYAGHLNVSRQDIKWSDPAIMQIIAEDFVHRYAVETDQDAVAQFLASITNTAIAGELSAAGVTAAIFEAASNAMTTADGAPLPDTLWVAPDMWGSLGSLVNNNGTLVFPSVTPTSAAGNLLGLRLVVDPWFTAGTAVVGTSRFLEWYEDIDGLMQVAEPDVLGQLVGYAGYGAFLNTKPDLFTPLTLTAPAPALAEAKTAAK